MTEKDLLTAFSEANEDYIEHAAEALEGRKKPAGGWLKRTALLAAALCLVIAGTVGVVLSSVREPDGTAKPDASDLPYLPLLDYTADSNQLTGKQYAQIGTFPGSSHAAANLRDVDYAYEYGIVISARVIEVLPDTYRLLSNTSEQYHILHLTVNDTVTGTNLPKELYYLLPAELSTDLMEYTDILFAMEQVGRDGYLVVNESQSRLESFSLLFRAEFVYNAGNGPVIAYTDQTVDEGLWDKEGWAQYKEQMQNRLDPDNYPKFPIKRTQTLEEAKASIRAYSNNPNQRVSTLADFSSDAAKEAIAYVKPFVNGAFRQDVLYEKQLVYIRTINGFDTGETIHLNGETGEVTYSDERYTIEDLQKIPDIGTLIGQLEGETLTPPHLDTTGLTQMGAQISGWYRKADGKVYGIVKIEWVYTEKPSYQALQYRDAAYYLATSDGTYRSIEPDELSGIIGDDHRVVEYKPNEPIPVPMP